jgi:hypothetical protein
MATEVWPDERLHDLARALEPLPAKVAELDRGMDHLCHETEGLRRDLTTEALATRDEFAAIQRQFVQMAWGLVLALVGAVAALTAALL